MGPERRSSTAAIEFHDIAVELTVNADAEQHGETLDMKNEEEKYIHSLKRMKKNITVCTKENSVGTICLSGCSPVLAAFVFDKFM